MRRLLLGLTAAVVISTGSATEAAARPPDHAPARHVRLDGVDVVLQDGTTRVVTVNRTHGFHARVVLWALRDGAWAERLRATDGRIGYGGLVVGTRRRQGTGTTPLGSYGLISAFGTHAAKPTWSLGYRKIRRGDFWVEDNGSRFYNRYRNQRQGGFRWRLPVSAENGSERLTDYPVEYEYSIVTSFNQGQVRHRGAGIFLHVNGSGATAGCVSAPRRFLAAAMGRLDANTHPVIAIGR